MNNLWRQKQQFPGLIYLICLSSGLGLWLNIGSIGQSQTLSQPVALKQALSFNSTAIDFEDEGRPPSRTSAGSRGSCLEQLIALVPGEEELKSQPGDCLEASQALPTVTLEPSPIFWFYVPQQSRPNATAEFVLLDERNRPMVTQQVTLPEQAGIIGVRLSQPIATHQLYRWVFSIEVNPRHPSENPTVTGMVQWRAPDSRLQAQIAAIASPEEKINFYANQGFWHDTITTLANLRQANPNSERLAQDWQSLLSSAGLKTIANSPLLGCCTAN
jgi:hypothetical protein